MAPPRRTRPVTTPDTPAQLYAGAAGLFLVALGILSLIFEGGNFGSVGRVGDQPEFLIWSVSGWTAIFWIVMGAIGLLCMARLDSARSYAMFAGVVFAVVAVWGFIDGNNVASILAADTTNNITHAVLGALGLLTGMMPRAAQRPSEAHAATEDRTGRFRRGATDRPRQASHHR
jgi:hypothetical protein